MHVGKKFVLHGYIIWTKWELLFLLCIGIIPTAIHLIFGWSPHFKFPYFITAILGTAVVFVIALKNNNAISRLDEASKLYSNIQAISSNLGLQLQSYFLYLPDKVKQTTQQTIVKQHIAWLTALRYLLREEKPWENLYELGNKQFKEKHYEIPEVTVKIEEALKPYLTSTQIQTLLSRKSDPSYCLELQSSYIAKLAAEEKISSRAYDNMLTTLKQLNNLKSACVRLKNTPYPRNFFSVTQYLLIFFLLVLPLSVYTELPPASAPWVSTPISMLIGWIFICLEKIGQNTSNPFEGGVNDVPISTISREIEITLKTMCNFPENEVPEELKPMSGFIAL